MSQTLWLLNPNSRPEHAYGKRQQAALSAEMMAQARADLKAWPVYAQTPLVSLPGLADRLNVRSLSIKDEGRRQPLESFKALGGAYALAEALRDHAQALCGVRPAYEELWAGALAELANDFPVTAASDGNHGRSLAWGAQLLGCPCTIYLPANVSRARADLIAAFGATIVRVEGNYEAAVAAALSDADRFGRTLIQDTSFPGYFEHCRRIMAGYTLMAEEIRGEWQGPLPTHVFLQVGCGGMAAAIAADFWLHWGAERPAVVLVEALEAASFFESMKAGAPALVEGDLDTIMIGISCGEVSLLAWDILDEGADHALAIPDAAAIEAMRLLRAGVAGDPPLVLGETGVAGIAALLEAARSPELANALGLDAGSRVLLIGSEGAVDRLAYEAFTRPADAVA